MEEIKKQIEKLEEELKVLKNKLRDTVNDEWIPNECEIYYFVDLDYMEVDCCRWNNGEIDNIRLNHKTIFETRKEADEYLEYLEEKEKHMNTFTEEEWKREDITKFCYYCQYSDNGNTYIRIGTTTRIRESIKSYFRTEEEVKDFIQKYEWQIKHELGVN